jgi:phosphoribosylglycinamide formyltransferase-1
MKALPRIAIFASGNGSNAQRIAEYFRNGDILEISAIYCNNPKAFVLERAEKLGIPSVLFNRTTFFETEDVLTDLENRKTDWIVLAGFLWLIPGYLLESFPNRIINIHPALLPKYGGKGMYGAKVHEAVIASGEKESGISIHYVNANYDEGQIIFQAKFTLSKDESVSSLAEKVHFLEYEHYPKVISDLVSNS